MNCLHVDSIQKSFGHQVVLNNVFLQCYPGEIIGLLGRNGSGKSTLLKIIFGSLYTENRYVKINDFVTQSLSDNRTQLVYLPQHTFLPAHTRIKTLAGLMLNKEAESKFSDLSKPYFSTNKRVNELSGGERRIAELLLLILSSAKYILLDEPFNGLAPLQKEFIKSLILAESNQKGFIITDHDYRNILDISQQLVFLKDGRLLPIKADELQDYGYLP